MTFTMYAQSKTIKKNSGCKKTRGPKQNSQNWQRVTYAWRETDYALAIYHNIIFQAACFLILNLSTFLHNLHFWALSNSPHAFVNKNRVRFLKSNMFLHIHSYFIIIFLRRQKYPFPITLDVCVLDISQSVYTVTSTFKR
jgi:hypothetical protein